MEANWKPLEMRLGAVRCAGFMFMGCLNGINQYKHVLSRRYLFLDDEGRAYEAAGRKEFREISFDEALAFGTGRRAIEGVGRDARNEVRRRLRESQGSDV